MAGRIAAFAWAAFCFAVLVVASGPAGAAGERRDPGATAGEAYAQAQQRARTRIRISPRCYYRTRALDYPPPYACEAPGPGYVRQCNSWLAQEARPSGTVLVPHMRCWWVPG
jgi:hypothetical protein